MTLGMLLPCLSENEEVIVYCNDEKVAHYDGKDSIPVELNEREIVEKSIYCAANVIYIVIKEENENE